MQSLDEIRHIQTQIHSLSNYNKYYNGMHDPFHMVERVLYLSVPRSFFDDAMTAGPFEFMVSVGFAFEYVLTNLLFVPFVSGAAYNGDMGTMTFGFSAQSDEARHMTLGLECIKFMLEQDPANLPIVQRWIDKWTGRGMRVLMLVGTMMDYMLPKRVMSWKEAWEIYFEQNGGALFADLARYGHQGAQVRRNGDDRQGHITHQAWAALYNYGAAAAFHTRIPSAEEMDWLSSNIPTPSTNTTARVSSTGASRRSWASAFTPRRYRCYVRSARCRCSSPSRAIRRRSAIANPSIAATSSPWLGPLQEEIFDNEPEKYIQAWLPTHQVYQGNCFPEGADPSQPGFEPLTEVLKYYNFNPGRDNWTSKARKTRRISPRGATTQRATIDDRHLPATRPGQALRTPHQRPGTGPGA